MCRALNSRYQNVLLINLVLFALSAPIAAQISSPNAAGRAAAAPQDSKGQYQNGIDLYEKGDFGGAVKILKDALKHDKSNVMLWHYLGLAFDGLGKLSDARKAHEKAAKAGELLLTFQMSKGNGPDYLDLLRTITPEIRFASSSAIRYLQLSPDISKSKHSEARDRADLLSDAATLSRSEGDPEGSGKVITNKEATTKARILSKPEPQYTEEARQHQTTGTVILRAILGGDGRLHAIIPVKSLPDGLTQKAIFAAHQITFEPATKDGHPVSVVVQIEYNFNLY